MARKQIAAWIVRNTAGQYIGTYRAVSAEQAIDRFIQEQVATATTFRRSQPLSVVRSDFTATSEDAQ